MGEDRVVVEASSALSRVSSSAGQGWRHFFKHMAGRLCPMLESEGGYVVKPVMATSIAKRLSSRTFNEQAPSSGL